MTRTATPLEQRHQPFDDTWRSWVEGPKKLRLFLDGMTEEQKSNMMCPGMFPADQGFRIARVEVAIEASSQELQSLFVRETTIKLLVADRYMITLRARKALGGMNLLKEIEISPRQGFYVELAFGPEAQQAAAALERKVGPGAGWVEIRVTLDGMQTRSAQ